MGSEPRPPTTAGTRGQKSRSLNTQKPPRALEAVAEPVRQPQEPAWSIPDETNHMACHLLLIASVGAKVRPQIAFVSVGSELPSNTKLVGSTSPEAAEAVARVRAVRSFWRREGVFCAPETMILPVCVVS